MSAGLAPGLDWRADRTLVRVLQVDAVADLLAGLLLLAGTWDGLWEALDLPQAKPALFVQIGGATLLGCAWLLWRASREPALRLAVARAIGGVNALAVVVIVVWLARGGLGIDALGTALLIAMAAGLAVLAALELGLARPRA